MVQTFRANVGHNLLDNSGEDGYDSQGQKVMINTPTHAQSQRNVSAVCIQRLGAT